MMKKEGGKKRKNMSCGTEFDPYSKMLRLRSNSLEGLIKNSRQSHSCRNILVHEKTCEGSAHLASPQSPVMYHQ